MASDSGVKDAGSSTLSDDDDAEDPPTGLCADGTFQIGARGTFRSSPARSWKLVASAEGAAAWLGDTPEPWWNGAGVDPAAGDVLETAGGERYEVRSIISGSRIRLRTLGPRLPRTTIQLTLLGERGRTTIALHQEGLPDQAMREPMRDHWKLALDRIGDLFDDG